MSCMCSKCEICKKLDVEQRIKDQWWDVELFRLVKGRLPIEDGDKLTKSMAKEFIDKFVFGSELCEGKKINISDSITQFSFHVFSSTNQAYED